jgi:hypothetical protein
MGFEIKEQWHKQLQGRLKEQGDESTQESLESIRNCREL